MALAEAIHVPRAARTDTGFASVLLLAVLVAFAFALPNLADPMIRYDDYPALLAQPEGFWAKTLHEGRWVNYIWHLRGVVTPAWLNFAVYQTLWAIIAASLAWSACGGGAQARFFAPVAALMVLVAPPATLISLWFNTLIPGLALVAGYALLASLAPNRARVWMPVFVVLSFMAYTTYPLLIFAACLLATPQRSWRDLIGLCALFAVSFVAAVLLVYTLNWQVHGVFGVPLADWREAAPASDITGLLNNLPLLAASAGEFAQKVSFGFAPAAWFHLGLLIWASVVLARRAPWEALYLWAGMLMGLGLIVVQILKMGGELPPRGLIFVWVFYALIAVRAAQLLTGPGLAGRMMRNAVLLVLGSYLLQTFQQYATYRDWQAETRSLATGLTQVDTVFVSGDVLTLGSAQKAFVQNELALAYRMEQLGGPALRFCGEACKQPPAISIVEGRLVMAQ